MRRGIACATGAYVCWGLFPLYFRQLSGVAAEQVLAHRVVWSLVFLLTVLAARRQWAWFWPALRQPRVLGAFIASALLLSANWWVYVWAVSNGHVVDASLGYFITPMVSVLLGYGVLHERPRRAQWLALSLAGAGVLWLTWQAGQLPWIALTLAASFGSYGLLRKIAVLGPLEGLTLETLLLAAPAGLALAWWSHAGTAAFPAPELSTDLWLLGIGPVTAVPLLLFAAGARLIPLTLLGLLQYLSPTIQFVIGVGVFHEPFSVLRGIGFALIWLAVLMYTLEGWNFRRAGAANPVEVVSTLR